MHFHSFFAQSVYHSRPVGPALAAGNASLVSWTLTGDLLWMDPKTYKQTGTPKPGDALGWFDRELGRIKAHVSEQGLKIALKPSDVDAALAGTPHIVLSVEGALFADDASRVRHAYNAGIRHLQLVHFVASPLGDHQTDVPVHQGLSQLGKDVIAECNRLGMLVDLAHCTVPAVTAALSVSRTPMVWSHGSVTLKPAANPKQVVWRARQLPLDTARSITKAGGVVGLWAFAPDVGRSPEAYGARMLQMADWLGDENVAFGTDINGLGTHASIGSYADLRQVVDGWQASGVPEARIRRVASENYGRVLKAAMQARRA